MFLEYVAKDTLQRFVEHPGNIWMFDIVSHQEKCYIFHKVKLERRTHRAVGYISDIMIMPFCCC